MSAPRCGLGALRSWFSAEPSRWQYLVCVLSGVLLALPFPPFSQPWLAWVALVPWLLMVRTVKLRTALLGSWLTGGVFMFLMTYFMYLFGITPWILLAIVEGLAVAACGLFLWLTRGLPAYLWPVNVAVVWTAVEWLRAQSGYGISWGWLAHSQVDHLWLIQIASWTSALGVSFLIALVNGAAADLVLSLWAKGGRGWQRVRGPLARGAGAAALVAGVALWGGARFGRLEAERGREERGGGTVLAAVIQACMDPKPAVETINIPWSERDPHPYLANYSAMTREAGRRGAGLILWAESGIPGILSEEPELRERIASYARETKAYLLAGGPYTVGRREDPPGVRKWFNSAYLFSPRGELVGRYDKVYPVPFGEFIPLRNILGPIAEGYRAREYDTYPGAGFFPLGEGNLKVGVAICDEGIYPRVGQQLARRGARVLAVISNEAWFRETAVPIENARVQTYRAVETGLYLLRCVNTGVSTIVAPSGRTLARGERFERTSLYARIVPKQADTFFATRGPVFAVAVTALAGALLAWGVAGEIVRRRRRG